MKNIFKEWVESLTRDQISQRQLNDLQETVKRLSNKVQELESARGHMQYALTQQSKYLASLAKYLKVVPKTVKDEDFINEWEVRREKIEFEKE